MIDSIGIQEVLPHRYPFLLVDRITEFEHGKRAVGIKNVTINEPFFQGHFPGNPVMPGVLILEAMAQVVAFAALGPGSARGKVPYLVGVDRARFRRPVVPGDQLRLETELVRVRGDFGRVACSAFVDGKLVADAEMTFALVDVARSGKDNGGGPSAGEAGNTGEAGDATLP
ncbi:MAG: 3-hydroxyacyl-[acyl-carrier-protein] dehydratase [Bacillota bacterium]|nr:3-hydroxyacyl-[acyl-carrier-protein] dehydratase [Bacillota bacterium]